MSEKITSVIVYGMGTIFVLLWAVFGVLDYLIAMIMCSGCLAVALILEGQQARAHHKEKIYRIKLTFASIIVVLCLLMILGQ